MRQSGREQLSTPLQAATKMLGLVRARRQAKASHFTLAPAAEAFKALARSCSSRLLRKRLWLRSQGNAPSQ